LNDNIPWADNDRVHKLITEDIPERVAADIAYQNAKKNSDKQNARIEHDKALTSAIVVHSPRRNQESSRAPADTTMGCARVRE